MTVGCYAPKLCKLLKPNVLIRAFLSRCTRKTYNYLKMLKTDREKSDVCSIIHTHEEKLNVLYIRKKLKINFKLDLGMNQKT